MTRMQEKMNRIMEAQGDSSPLNIEKLTELNNEIQSIMKERDQYFLKMTQHEILVSKQNEELE